MRKQIVVVRINGEVHGKIISRPRGIVFATCDAKGTHLSLWKKTNSAFHVELSSDEPLGSVWDEARVGIARHLGWPRAEKHSNYIINRAYAIPALSDPLPLASFYCTSQPPARKGKYEKMPALNLTSRIPWHGVALTLFFRAPVDCESAVSFSLGWAWLRLTIVHKDIEPARPRISLRRGR